MRMIRWFSRVVIRMIRRDSCSRVIRWFSWFGDSPMSWFARDTICGWDATGADLWDAICRRDLRQKILQEKIKMQEIFLARTEKDARNKSCRSSDLCKIYFMRRTELDARFISCKIFRSLQDLFRAFSSALCKIYFVQRMEKNARNILCDQQIFCKKYLFHAYYISCKMCHAWNIYFLQTIFLACRKYIMR